MKPIQLKEEANIFSFLAFKFSSPPPSIHLLLASMVMSFKLKVEGLLGLKTSYSFYENLSSSSPLQYPSINLMI